MNYKNKNPLLEKISNVLAKEPKGKLLDLGCGGGDFAKKSKDLGFEVIACDIYKSGFIYQDEIKFIEADLNKGLRFENEIFDFVLFLEVIEHLSNPYFVLSEINRILKKKGILFISTPNILNLKSRFRYLFEGVLDYYREPPLDQITNPKEKNANIHLFLYRIQELEFALFKNGFEITDIFTSYYEPGAKALSFLLPIIKFQSYLKCRRSLKKGGIDFRRLHNIILSRDLLFGRHLIIRALKAKGV